MLEVKQYLNTLSLNYPMSSFFMLKVLVLAGRECGELRGLQTIPVAVVTMSLPIRKVLSEKGYPRRPEFSAGTGLHHLQLLSRGRN